MTYSFPDRPEMQRTDLGPIMNDVACSVFAIARTPYLTHGIVEEINTGGSDFQLFRKVVSFATDTVVEISNSICSRLDPVNRIFTQETLQGELTHYGNSQDVSSEGVKSGVIVPANAVLTKIAEEQGVRIGDNAELYIDFNEISMLLQNRRFQNSLIRLAHAPNGTYSESSTDQSRIGSSLLPQSLCLGDVRMFNGNSLSDTAKRKLKVLAAEKAERSDGCPVRRSTYPKLGDYAIKYAKLNGLSLEQLTNQKKSAIVAGAEYLARVFASIDQATMKTKAL